MKVKDVMTHDVVRFHVNTPFKEIVHALIERQISGAPVVDEAGHVVGVVTESDLIAKQAFPHPQRRSVLSQIADVLSGHESEMRKADAITAKDLMTAPVVTAEPDDHVGDAARRFLRDKVKRMPVVDDGILVGIVSRRDVLRVFDRGDHDLEAAAAALLKRTLYVPPEHDVSVTVNEGVVVITGRVLLKSDVDVVSALVGAIPGVIGVRNFLFFQQEDPAHAGVV